MSVQDGDRKAKIPPHVSLYIRKISRWYRSLIERNTRKLRKVDFGKVCDQAVKNYSFSVGINSDECVTDVRKNPDLGRSIAHLGAVACMDANPSVFVRFSDMNERFGFQVGDPHVVDMDALKVEIRNLLDKCLSIQIHMGANADSIHALRDVAAGIEYNETKNMVDVRHGLCGIHGVAYGAHRIMGLNADEDMDLFIDEAMSRLIKDDADKDASIAMHAANGVKEVYFTGYYPGMLMRSAVDQPDAPKDQILNSASYKALNYSLPVLE